MIGIVLTVAITVLLAATVGAFVIELRNSVSEEPRASVSLSQNGGEVTAVLATGGNLAPVSLELRGDCGPLSGVTLSAVGASASGSCSSGDVITAVGTVDCQSGVVGRHEGD